MCVNWVDSQGAQGAQGELVAEEEPSLLPVPGAACDGALVPEPLSTRLSSGSVFLSSCPAASPTPQIDNSSSSLTPSAWHPRPCFHWWEIWVLPGSPLAGTAT